MKEINSFIKKATLLDLNDNTRLAMLPSSQGTTVVAPQNTTVVAGGKSQSFAGAIDAEALYLFT